MHTSQTTSAHRRGAVTRAMVTAAALAAVAGVAAAPAAVAAPAGPVAAAAGIATTDVQRVGAAAVVRVDPAPDVLLLNDHDVVHALW